jgi:hypothetical protein
MSNSGGLVSPSRRSKPLSTGKLISAYYLEVDYLLERIEGATTHYQTLGVERAAACDEIIQAYQNAVAVLHPSYHKVRAAVPDEMLLRVDQAFKKVSQAFTILTDEKKRSDYAKSLRLRSSAARPVERSKQEPRSQPRRSKIDGRNQAVSVELNVSPELQPVFTKTTAAESTVDRRRCERFKLSVPVLVAGHDNEGGKWQEVTKTIDVSRIGVALRLRRRVRAGIVVHVTMPLPMKLRSHGFSDAGYNMYAIVRRAEPLIDGMRIVGLEFIGAKPPADYLYKPWATFRTPKWKGPDRRREPREERNDAVAVEYLDEAMQRISREAAVTENVSEHGARLCVKGAPPTFEFVRVISPKLGFNGLALLRNQWTGKDGFERLCLQFVDQKWPM